MILQIILKAFMIISILNLLWTDIIFAEQSRMNSSVNAGITQNTPGLISTPFEDITSTAIKKKEKGSKLMYYLLGGALIAGGAVAGMGGSSTPDNPEKPTTGTIVISGPAP